MYDNIRSYIYNTGVTYVEFWMQCHRLNEHLSRYNREIIGDKEFLYIVCVFCRRHLNGTVLLVHIYNL